MTMGPVDNAFVEGTTETGTGPAAPPNSTNNGAPQRFYTEEDLARVREQEKSKLYPSMETMRTEITELRNAEKARQEEAARVAHEAEEADRLRREEEMSLKELLQQKEQEWERKFQEEKAAREQAAMLLEREQQFQALERYKSQRIDEVRDDIIPDLLELVSGNTPDEIEASIAVLQQKSASIIEAAAHASQQSRQNMVGSRVTSPAAGPLDTESGHKTFSAEEISAMPFAEYVKHRSALLGQAASGRNKGMFG